MFIYQCLFINFYLSMFICVNVGKHKYEGVTSLVSHVTHTKRVMAQTQPHLSASNAHIPLGGGHVPRKSRHTYEMSHGTYTAAPECIERTRAIESRPW